MDPFVFSMTLDMTMVDLTGRWQPGAIFRAMQESSTAHCESLNLGYEAMREKGVAWVLSRALMTMDEYPVHGDHLEIRTWPGPTRHAFFPRHYAFFKAGREIGRATTMYVVMDLKTRKTVLPAGLQLNLPAFDLPAPLPMPGNIAALDAETARATYTPVYTDYDMNGHVNNTRYVDWFADRFPVERHREKELSAILVHYLSEVLPGEEMTLSLQEKDDVSVLKGANGGAACFAIQGTWRERR